VENVANEAFLGTGGLGLFLLLLRHLVIAYYKARKDVIETNAETNIVFRLENEISRLLEINKEQREEILKLRTELVYFKIFEKVNKSSDCSQDTLRKMLDDLNKED